MTFKNSDRLAYILLILASLFWAGNFVIGKFASIYEIPAFSLNFYRWLFVCIILFPFTYKEISTHKQYIIETFRLFLVLCVTGITIFNYVVYFFYDFNADLRYIIFCSFFPILLYRILYLFSISENLISIGHILFVTIALLFSLMIITKRNSILRNNALLFSIGSFLYLVLSFTWLNQEIFLYPIF